MGRSMAIVAGGPSPGNTPIRVPRKTPARQYSRLAPVNMLAELHRVTPQKIRYETVQIEAGRSLTLKGKAIAWDDLYALRSALETSDRIFPVVESRQAQLDKNNQVDFLLVCTVAAEE